MPWYAWLAVGAVAACMVLAAALVALRATEQGRRFLGLSTRAKVRFGRALLGDAATPRPARLAIGFMLVYLAVPFDLVPDFIPGLGQADDALLVALIIVLVLALAPKDALDRAFVAAEHG